MTFKQLYASAIVLIAVLTAIATSSSRSTGLVSELRDRHGSLIYSWMIGEDEQERLSTLLEADFNDTGVVSTYVTGPPRVCPYCGKDTEFIDWVYTALKRGVHSPDFIFESLKAGRTPKGVHHDVYCSGCGHLTHARDRSGNEGGALHIAHATSYDRSTRTFIKDQAKSETSDEAILWIPSDPWFRQRVGTASSEPVVETKPETSDEAILWIPSDPWFRQRVGTASAEALFEINPESRDQAVFWWPSEPWTQKRAETALE